MKTSEELAKAIQSYKDGNPEAFATVYEQSYRYLYTCVMHIVKDEEAAQDMLQETYLEIVKSVGTIKSHLSRARAKIKFAVEELDVKKGTRLYNVAPLMFVLLEEEAKACILKPMSAALTGIAGVETAEKVSLFGKLKAAWAKLSAGAKAKVAVGTAAACTAGVAAAVIFSGPKLEPPVISEETKQLFDQVMQICEEGDYGKLCNLDFTVADHSEDDYPGTNVVLCYDENGEKILDQFHYDDDGKRSYSWYYDGKSCELKGTHTGYGIFMSGSDFAVGQFEDGKATGKVVSFTVRIHNDESSEKNPNLVGMDDTDVCLMEMETENEVLVGEASRMF